MFEALALKGGEVQRRAEWLREQVERLDVERQRRYYERYVPLVKDPDTYAALNWLACAGLHHFYLGKWLRGSVNLGVMLGGLFLLFFWGLPGLLVGALLVGGVILIELPALFRSQLIVEDHNVSTGEYLLRKLTPAAGLARRV